MHDVHHISIQLSHNLLVRKPTPSPPVGTVGSTRENGPNSQAKEAWPSLQPGQQAKGQYPFFSATQASAATSLHQLEFI